MIKYEESSTIGGTQSARKKLRAAGAPHHRCTDHQNEGGVMQRILRNGMISGAVLIGVLCLGHQNSYAEYRN